MQLRIKPDDPCVIEIFNDATEGWDTWYDPRTCIPTPQVDIVPTSGGNIVNFDMDDDGIVDGTFTVLDGADGADGAPGADGADGAPAPTPIVTISEPTPGNHLVEFDMDGNGTPENAVLIKDGENAAPTPAVTISEPSPGNHLVEFDMDGNGIPEDAVLISDGVNGIDGIDGVSPPSPLVRIDQTAYGVNVFFDMDADGTDDAAFTLYNGVNSVNDLPEFDGESRACNVASYFGDILLPSLYATVLQKKQENAADRDLINALFAVAVLLAPEVSIFAFYGGTSGVVSALRNYDDVEISNAATPLFWEEFKQVMYCFMLEDGDTGNVDGFVLERVAQLLSEQPTQTAAHDIVNALLRSMSVELGQKAALQGSLRTGDCAAYDCTPIVTVIEFDFSTPGNTSWIDCQFAPPYAQAGYIGVGGYTPGSGVLVTTANNGTNKMAFIRYKDGNSYQIDRVEADVSGTTNRLFYCALTNGDENGFTFVGSQTAGFNTPGSLQTLTFEFADLNAENIDIHSQGGETELQVKIEAVRIYLTV